MENLSHVENNNNSFATIKLVDRNDDRLPFNKIGIEKQHLGKVFEFVFLPLNWISISLGILVSHFLSLPNVRPKYVFFSPFARWTSTHWTNTLGSKLNSANASLFEICEQREKMEWKSIFCIIKNNGKINSRFTVHSCS